MFKAALQPGLFQIHSYHTYHWKLVILMLSVTSMKSKVAMAQDSGCLYIIPMPPPLPNFLDFVIHHQDNKVASLKEGGTKDNALTRAIQTIEKNCDCNATTKNMQTVNLIRECPKTLSANWSLDYSHCKTETTTVMTSTRPTTPKSYETTLTTSKYATPPSISTTNSSLPGIGEVHTADTDHNSIIIAAVVIPLIVMLGMAAFIIYKYKNRGWCTDFSLKPSKRRLLYNVCYQARESAPPPSQTSTNGKLPTTFPSEGTENLGMETAESPVSIIPMENRFSTFGRPKSQAVSEYSASISLEDQSPDHVPIRNGTNNNRKPRSLYLDLGALGTLRPGDDDDIPYMDQCPTPSPGPTPTSPSAGFNAGFSRGISRVELI
ncbi:uncharacterized protein LOC135485462 isoform X2 [Lineus longissimus]|uniref:uncharacterized protein LOC135485462 isoform X2 n=1 Tax=Lineus longissimus TaxID=88925 RepID=UPI00315DAEB4